MILTRSLDKNPSCMILEKILARSCQVLASDCGMVWQDSSDKILEKILARSCQVLASDSGKIYRIKISCWFKVTRDSGMSHDHFLVSTHTRQVHMLLFIVPVLQVPVRVG